MEVFFGGRGNKRKRIPLAVRENGFLLGFLFLHKSPAHAQMQKVVAVGITVAAAFESREAEELSKQSSPAAIRGRDIRPSVYQSQHLTQDIA